MEKIYDYQIIDRTGKIVDTGTFKSYVMEDKVFKANHGDESLTYYALVDGDHLTIDVRIQ